MARSSNLCYRTRIKHGKNPPTSIDLPVSSRHHPVPRIQERSPCYGGHSRRRLHRTASPDSSLGECTAATVKELEVSAARSSSLPSTSPPHRSVLPETSTDSLSFQSIARSSVSRPIEFVEITDRASVGASSEPASCRVLSYLRNLLFRWFSFPVM